MSTDKDILALNHDVNNQLGVAMGNFEIMMLKFPDLQETVYAERIEKGLLRARDLSHELAKTYSDANTINLNKKDFVLLSVQEHILNNAQPEYDQLMEIYGINITLQIKFIDEPKKAYLNPTELRRLRENFVSNSLNAGATEINVQLEMKETYLITTFTDNGKGMTQEALDKILLFLHGDGIIHGLGTRNIVEGANKHGYSINYTSVLGEGTSIRALVPYYEE